MLFERILADKHKAVELRRRDLPLERFAATLPPADRSFADALGKPRCGFILECKRASPSGGLLRDDFDPAAIARQYADVADAISVLTDEPFFQGSLSDLQRVREAVSLPVLCKDFVVDPYQVYEARRFGADAILLMLSVLDAATLQRCLRAAEALSMDALVEVHDERELALALDLGAGVIGINNRDLQTLEVDLAVTERLAPLVPTDGRTVLVSESGIGDHRDVLRLRHRVDAFLVGTSLMRCGDVAIGARELVYGRVKTCGLTSPEDARAAWRAGASWGGLIFAGQSPRCVSPDEARQIRRAAPMRWVGVFVDEHPERIGRLVDELGLAAVQLHGEESPETVRQLRRTLPAHCAVWKAWRVRQQVPRIEQTGADRLLLDSYAEARRGGTGERFDWSLLSEYPQREEVILAGGLDPTCAAEADRLATWALDVNSGVEEAPGKKSEGLLRDFFGNLRPSRGSVEP